MIPFWHKYRYIFAAVGIVVYSSCQTTELSPSFLRIDTLHLQTDAAAQGTASHNSQTVWVYANDQPLGVFELPTVVPILEEGSTDIIVFAGINKNGQGNNRVQYPFYSPVVYNNLPLVAQKTTTLTPSLQYNSNTNFAFVNDFELGNNLAEIDNGGSGTFTLSANPNEVFEGDRCGKAHISTLQPQLRLGTNTLYSLPGNNAPVYIEMNYRCDAPFRVQLRGTNGVATATYPNYRMVNTRSYWNKIYLDFTEDVSQMQAQGLTAFQVLIETDLPDTLSTADFYWDNIKLLY